MTIQGWVLFGILALFILSFGIFGAIIFEKIVWKVLGIVALHAPHHRTLCRDALVLSEYRQRSTGNDRPEKRTGQWARTDGEIIAQYTGKIDIEGNDGGYVLFDYEGKRYTYYNCFVESIADIK